MGKELRIFTQIENLPKTGFFKNIYLEKRADLYIIFPDLPLEYSKTFGLKFRDVFIGKDYIESNILELKILKKAYADGIEVWQKVLSERLDKNIKIFEKSRELTDETHFIDKDPVKINRKEVLEQIFSLVKGEILGKIGENPRILFALVSKVRKQSKSAKFSYEKTFVLLKMISKSLSQEKYFVSFCWEDFKEEKIEDFVGFQKKMEKISGEHKITEKDFKGYPQFILENV